MHVLGKRWGFIVILLGLPVLGRGLARGDALAWAGGLVVIVAGLAIWALHRGRRTAGDGG